MLLATSFMIMLVGIIAVLIVINMVPFSRDSSTLSSRYAVLQVPTLVLFIIVGISLVSDFGSLPSMPFPSLGLLFGSPTSSHWSNSYN